MTNEEVRAWLDEEWQIALESPGNLDGQVERLVNSPTASIRFAVFTQLLGKIADPARSLIVLQLAAGWDARSFCSAVVVPWVRANNNVVGSSGDPYVSNPLRRPTLHERQDQLRDRAAWDALVAFLGPLDRASSGDLQDAFRRVLRANVRRLSRQTFLYPIPQRISLGDLESKVDKFLDIQSGGLRPLAVATALLRLVGEGFSLFSNVTSQGINEADAATGMPGDIMCFQGEDLRLVVEVKDVNLTIAHVSASSLKAKESEEGIASLLFAVPGIHQQDEKAIAAVVGQEWAAGLNIYSANILTLMRSVFVLLEETWRIRFLRGIGSELDRHQDQAARRSWYDLLTHR